MENQLDPTCLKTIGQIMAGAHLQDRSMLFEHEVYAILAVLGLNTPVHILIRDEKEITARLLAGFSSEKIVMKVVARELAHKQHVGGVQTVYKDLEFVKYSYRRMQAACADRKLEVAGILFVEHITYSKDLVNFFQNDPEVDVIGCYIEGFKKYAGRKFFNIATQSKKPIVVYKAGRTEAGRKATESHTASIAGEYPVAKAAMKQAGLILAETMIDHGDFIKTFALLNGFQVNGNRVAVIANAGYEKTCAADNLGDLQVAALDAETTRALEKILPSMAVAEPLLDLTPMADDETFAKCMEIMLGSGFVDALFVSIVPHSARIHTTDAEIDQKKDNIAARIVQIVHKYKKPVAISINVVSDADAIYNKLGKTLDSGGVPTFLTAKRAMLCLNAFVRYWLLRKSDTFGEWLK